ncbi:MAG: hypothetical protein RI973_1261 [Bacteroidota bacterium]
MSVVSQPNRQKRSSVASVGNRLLPLTLLLLMVSSCVKDQLNDLELTYNGTLAVPIATVGFTLSEALEGDTVLTIGDDNSIRLAVRQDNFFELSAADLLDELTGTLEESFSQQTAIGKVRIPDVNNQFQVPFVDIVSGFPDVMLQQLLLSSNGSFAPMPAFQQNPASDLSVVSFSDFSWIEVDTGTISLTVKNNLFFDLENLSATVLDVNSGQTITQIDFPLVPAGGGTATQVSPLDDILLGNSFKVVLNSIGSQGSGGIPVFIDLNKSLDFTLDISDVTINSGEAKLVAGTLAKDTLDFDFQLSNGERLYQALVNSVSLKADLSSSVKTPITIRLTFPAVYKNNQPVVQEFTLPTTPPGSPLQIDLGSSFSGSAWNFDQDISQPYNRMGIIYEVILENNTGGLIQFAATDEVSVSMVAKDFEVGEVRGFFGFREEILDNGNFDLDFDFSFLDPSSSPLLFTNPRMLLYLENSFGIPLESNFNVLANGSFGGQASLDPPKFSLNYPGIAEIGQTKTTSFLIDKNNSKLVELLSVYPASLGYSGNVVINPANDLQIVNFIRSDSRLKADAEFDLPFSFRVEDLVYRDTGEALELTLEDGLTIDDIARADMKILYKNGMPLKTGIRLIALSASGEENTVVNDFFIEPAAVDDDGKVTADGKAEGEVRLSLDNDQIRLMDEATSLIFEVHFQSGDGGALPATMFTDYDVELKIGMTVTIDK